MPTIVYSQQTCTAAEIKDALRKALFEYFESPTDSKLSVNEIKDFLHFYISSDTNQFTLDCSGSGALSGKPYYLMLGAARNIQKGIPTCSDGTEYGKCSSNGMYCYGGRIVEKCVLCGCGENQGCDTTTNKCVPSSQVPEQGKGNLVLAITDEKVQGLSELNVEIAEVEVHKDNQWVSFAPAKKKFELLSLADAADVIGSKQLTPGKYTQIRFQVVSADLRFEDGTTASVKIPSGEIKLVREFTIEKGKTTYLYIDFSSESVVKAGKQYILQPVIQLKTLSEFTKDLCETLLPTCNDNSPCTSDGCSNAACTYTPLSDGTNCGTGKVCKAGACIQTCEILNCDDKNPCTADSCSEGVCSNTPLADKTACGSGLLCKSGTCVQQEVFCYGVSCDDNNPCTTDSCSVGVCKYQLALDGTSCGTGKICKSGVCTLTDPCSIIKFRVSQNITTLTGVTIRILLTDFDGDGDLDLARGGVLTYENWTWYPNKPVYKIKVFFNDGKGQFSDSGQLFGTDSSFNYDAGDVDGDGDKDIVVGNLYGGYIGVFFNDGKGYFAASQQKVGSYYDYVPRLADLDKDGDLDLYAGANYQTRTGKIFLNDGKGIFTQLNNSGLSVGPVSAAVLFDSDKDGDIDLVEATSSVNSYISSTNTTIRIPAYERMYKNNGAGLFTLTQERNVSSTGSVRELGFGDVDKDGDIDYITMTSGPASGGLYLNDGIGTFTKDMYFESQKNQSYITQAYYNVASDGLMVDVDNDKDLDPAIAGIVLANDGTGKLKTCPWVHGLNIIWHTGVPFGDIDGDGDLDMIGYNIGNNTVITSAFDNVLIT